MKFCVYRASASSVSKDPPCAGAVRGPEAEAWPGEYLWFIDFANLNDLVHFIEMNGGGIGVFSAQEVGEEHPAIEIFDDDQDDDDDEAE
jgi:hypothetical protein